MIVVQDVDFMECPLCGGHGASGRQSADSGDTEEQQLCRLCRGEARVARALIQELCDQMERVANAMQAGDPDRAAQEARLAAHLANRMIGRD